MIGFSSVLLFMTLFYYSVVNTGQVFFILTILFYSPQPSPVTRATTGIVMTAAAVVTATPWTETG